MTEKRKVRALLADDEVHIRQWVRVVLAKLGCEVVGEAGNGQQAVELFRQLRPDVTLLDINMPVMDGTRALEAIMAEFPEAFVVMFTSVSDMGTVQACLDRGAANYLRKDLPMPEMMQEIRESWLARLTEQTDRPLGG